MGSQVLIADLHLTDNPADEYRWGLFPWLQDKIRQLPGGTKTGIILGDLTDAKDRHSAKLVNRVVDNIVGLYRAGLQSIIILRGNHDGLDDSVAYFEFLKHFPYIDVITKPVIQRLDLRNVAFLPHTRKPAQDWALIELGSVPYIFMHATVEGAEAETGRALTGDQSINFLQDYKAKIYSGDVHVPQKIGNITYVGAPYPIRFGDKYKGRVLVLDGTKQYEWNYEAPQKRVIRISNLDDLKTKIQANHGDQVKFEVMLGKESLHDWPQITSAVNKWCVTNGVTLSGTQLVKKAGLKLKNREPSVAPLTSDDAMKKYIGKSQIGEERAKVGLKLLKRAKSA